MPNTAANDAGARQSIWTPSPDRIRRANLSAFIGAVSQRAPAVVDYPSLYEFSVREIDAFWDCLWDFLGIVGEKGHAAFREGPTALDARWFAGGRLNFAENHLRRRDDGVAIISRAEGGNRRTMTWRELHDAVSRLAGALVADGVRPGDRVAACLPNVPETVIAALATAAIGAIWSACAPEYKPEAIVDRLGQIEPKALFLADDYRHGGRRIELAGRNAELVRSLPSVKRAVLVSDGRGDAPVQGMTRWNDFVAARAPAEIAFERFAFDYPLYILYSSGTTGKPKAIVHGAGASLLQSAKEMVLHCDCRPGEPVFFHTTAAWMVWNIMLASLAWGAPIVLYDGSPTYPDENILFDIIATEGVGVARIVPPLIDTYIRAGVRPRETHDLASLRCILSGSAPLLPHHYEYVYAQVKTDLHLMSPAGGTDIMATLASGNPIGPVYPGEIQCRSLGMKAEVFDEEGRPVVGQRGELVCTRPFPSIPLGFWGEPGRERVANEYFSTFPGVWRHGDWAEITPGGGVIIYGRADATLKVNGVRIGTAEIYRGLERVHEVREAVVVTHRGGAAEAMVLFVVLGDGVELDDALRAHIKQTLRDAVSVRHVPDRIFQVPDLPRSLNGKPSEIAVRDAVNGRPLSNWLGLTNPEIVDLFRNMPALTTQVSPDVAPPLSVSQPR